VLGSPGRTAGFGVRPLQKARPVIGRQRMPLWHPACESNPGPRAGRHGERSEAERTILDPRHVVIAGAGAPAYRATVTRTATRARSDAGCALLCGPPGALLERPSSSRARDRGIELRQQELPPVRIIRREHVLRLSVNSCHRGARTAWATTACRHGNLQRARHHLPHRILVRS